MSATSGPLSVREQEQEAQAVVDLDLENLSRASSWHELVIKAVRLVGWQRWNRRRQYLERMARRYGFLQRSISETHSFELRLPDLYRRAMLTDSPPSTEDLATRDALALATFLANLSDAMSRRGRSRLVGQVTSALDCDSGFGP